ncbi:MAG: hypothetical protein OXE75_16090 [bacterium]|nr:hypothetical protein [bacterium]
MTCPAAREKIARQPEIEPVAFSVLLGTLGFSCIVVDEFKIPDLAPPDEYAAAGIDRISLVVGVDPTGGLIDADHTRQVKVLVVGIRRGVRLPPVDGSEEADEPLAIGQPAARRPRR